MKDVLIIEPFCGGSHGQLIQLLVQDEEIGHRCETFCLPAKKWQWRARTSSVYLSQVIPISKDYRVLFTSSVLNLAELVALRPDLSKLKKIVYFHENQLIYPVRKHQDRDFQYGYNQILSSLVADAVAFNSAFNMESFLSSISSFMNLIPDYRPKNLASLIRHKCQILYFAVDMKGTDRNAKLKQDLEAGYRDSSTTRDSTQDIKLSNITHSPKASAVSHPLVSHNNDIEPSAVQDMRKVSDEIKEEMVSRVENVEDSVNNSNNECQRSKLPKTVCNQTANPLAPHKTHTTCDKIFTKWRADEMNEDWLHIVWPHRWEHDKDPESFFAALLQLQQEGFNFYVSVIGETFSEVPEIFTTAHQQLGWRVRAWGFQSRPDYLAVLDSAHVVVSTARHEFFGVSMLEAVSRNCYPLCPNRLVYPEIYPKECLYSTQNQLIKRLKRFCQKPLSVNTSICKTWTRRVRRMQVSFILMPAQSLSMDPQLGLIDRFSWEQLQEHYKKLILV